MKTALGALIALVLIAGCAAPGPRSLRWSEVGDPPAEDPFTRSELSLISASVVAQFFGPFGAVFLIPAAVDAEAFETRRRRAEKSAELYGNHRAYAEGRRPDAPLISPAPLPDPPVEVVPESPLSGRDQRP